MISPRAHLLLLATLLPACTPPGTPPTQPLPPLATTPPAPLSAPLPATRPATDPYISFTKSGGFLGIHECLSLTARPPATRPANGSEIFIAAPADIRLLAEELETRGAFRLRSPDHPGFIRDAFEYSLVVHDGRSQRRAVLYDPGALPGEAEKMLEFHSLLKSFATQRARPSNTP